MNNFLSNYSVKTKIIGNSIFFLLLMIISTLFGLFSMIQIGDELKSISEKDIPMTQLLTTMTEHQLEQAILFERAVRYGYLLKIQKKTNSHFKDNIHRFEQTSHKVNKEIKKGETLAESMKTDLASGPSPTKKELSHIVQGLKQIEQQHANYEHHAQQIFKLLSQGKIQETEVLIEKIEHEEDKLIEHLKLLLTGMEKITAQAMLNAEHHEQKAITTLEVILLVAVILGLLLSWQIVSNISKLLTKVKASLNKIAAGDLTENISIQGDHQLTSALTKMQHKLLSMVSMITGTTVQLAAAAEETSAIVKKTQANIIKQQADTDMVSVAMNQMTLTVQEISKSISYTANAAECANQKAVMGNQLVDETGHTIQALADAIVASSDIINAVETESKTIGSVLNVIKGIAEQANLLALSAAIEAARAGEQGRGFSVVADEVRTLAERTQAATEEINQMISNLQGGSRMAVNAINNSCDQALSAVKQARQAGASINKISESVDKINEMSCQIATASEEQNAVSEEINRNIFNINDFANHSVVSSEKVAQASYDVARMAIELQGIVGGFKIA